MSFKVFIVEDDPWYGQLLLHHLSLNPDYEVSLFTTAKDLLNNLYKLPDLVCMDFGLPDMAGEKLLKEIQSRNKNIPVIIISGQEDIAVAVNLLKTGAKDYIIKDEHTKDLLWKSVINIKENLSLKKEVEELKEQLEHKYALEDSIIGKSDTIKKTFSLVQKAIQSNINVSLTGETGTGKEVFAKAIHYHSERKKKPFITVNMAAIPANLAESELFGYEKGAFTGALNTKKGKFEEAHGGTLFLDEIGELELPLQSKLLRVIQEREIVRVGSNKPIPIDIRLITATHKNLAEEVKKGNFREDLFFRVIGLPIELPPLRERQNDVLVLAKYFIDEYIKQNKIKSINLSEEAKTKLKKYAFPGNVRELKAVIDLACVMCNNNEIKAEDITFYQINTNPTYSLAEKTLREYENEIISHYLKKYDSNVLLVAEKLDIGKSKIYNLIKNGDIQID
ncbi:MAG: sigma-54 dependent transcriptional regulator [Raineya sp.]|jgi:DNA-binding NtrC family response regulator|nr:sigma-54 dependent transcriptional regulator [Raineya sp.]